MSPSTPLTVAGVDVGKSHLDAHILDGGHERRFDNTKVGRRALRNWLLLGLNCYLLTHPKH